MIDLNVAVNTLTQVQALQTETLTKATTNASMRDAYNTLTNNIQTLSAEIDSGTKHLETLSKAAVLLANVSEENTNQILNAITGVINKALTVLFPNDTKSIEITRSMYRDTHPHYTLTLKTSNNIVRTFNQSGTGLAQVISFLFTACLIDAKNGRKIMVMDELLNGLHPTAKHLVSDLMLALSTRSNDPFQFVCVEYGMDIGKQYEIKKGVLPNGLSVAEEWSSIDDKHYYASQAI